MRTGHAIVFCQFLANMAVMSVISACGRVGYNQSPSQTTITDAGVETCNDKLFNNSETQTDCGGPNCPACPTGLFSSCKTLLAAQPGIASNVYQLDPDGLGFLPAYYAYCDMDADGGGWTLALKVDGRSYNFEYQSIVWVSADPLNETSANLDQSEAKLFSFAGLIAKDVRVGFTTKGITRWQTLTPDLQTPKTLREIFASESFLPTTVGRAAWLQLVQGGSLQTNCNQEGFNNNGAQTQLAVRLGILGNAENDCASPDSFVGFGANTRTLCGSEVGSATGNQSDGGCANINIAAFGYIMVRE